MGLLARLLASIRRSPGGTLDAQVDDLSARATEKYLAEARRLAPAVSDILADVGTSVVPGTTTLAINDQIDRSLRAAGLEPAMKGYRGYPMSSTVSLNDELLHAIPSQRRVQDGDLLKIQTAGHGKEGFVAQGWTFAVGNISADGARLLSTGSQALRAAQAVIRAGARSGDVGAAIQETAEGVGLAVIREFVGSGIGRQLHQEPHLPCYGVRGRGRQLRAGEVLHVQVILKEGSPGSKIADDGWTALALDGRRGVIHSCMMEVERDGCRLLGRFLDG